MGVAESFIEIELLEFPGRQVRFTLLARNTVVRRSARQQTNDLVGIDEPAAAGLHHLSLVVPGGLQRSEVRLPPREFHVAPGRIRDDDLQWVRGFLGVVAIEHVQPRDHLLEAEVSRGWREAPRQARRNLIVKKNRR